jgi:transcription factor SPN1
VHEQEAEAVDAGDGEEAEENEEHQINENEAIDQEQEEDNEAVEEGEGGNDDGAPTESKKHKIVSSDESESEENDKEEDKSKSNKKHGSDYESIFSKKNSSQNKRKKKNVDSEELNEMDNVISSIIFEMKNVAGDDRSANEKSITAIHKLKMLPTVVNLLQKSDYHANMIELGILGAIAEWLAPLPDRSLPNIKIREQLIDALRDFGEINSDYLKSSGIGKAVMFLYKHPKETKLNKQKLEKLINNWARPIFNLDSNFKQLTKEERLQRDLEHVRTLNRRSSNETSQKESVDEMLSAAEKLKFNKKNKSRPDDSDKSGSDETKKFLRPGDPGFVPRARVPLPSSKDYVIRPKSNVDNLEISSKKMKKPESRLDKHNRRFIEIKRNAKTNRAVTMSVSK